MVKVGIRKALIKKKFEEEIEVDSILFCYVGKSASMRYTSCKEEINYERFCAATYSLSLRSIIGWLLMF